MRFLDSGAHFVGCEMACDLDDARAFLERLAHHVAPCVGTIDFLRIVGTVAGNNWALGRVTAGAGDDPARGEDARRRDHVRCAPLAEQERRIADAVEVANRSEAGFEKIAKVALAAPRPGAFAALLVERRRDRTSKL